MRLHTAPMCSSNVGFTQVNFVTFLMKDDLHDRDIVLRMF